MKLSHRVTVPADRERTWALFMDIPAVATCAPGVEDVVAIGDDRYRGRFRTGIGPIRLALDGDVAVVERDDSGGRAVLRASGADSRIGGGVRATVTLRIESSTPDSSEVVIESDVQVLGRIGELGQPLMKRKADEIMRTFGANLAARLR